ncbi:RNA polymerase sigma factor, sigma-70 family [Singulisphaera sp. GP187]|uniref:sigma-70 family RNA polymerase sigma factor n=1 Tax=Singulisphaera sp. GP187 TaxID=1882752 RepID=UPI00092CE167|nr:sigma-70 family RNA polymerase sigma factor [Singulisphaera sp. GP187]SIO65197.1 RNA polymerase sigma factor, sigma-70 family [Singulisphaera sp. GP187]
MRVGYKSQVYNDLDRLFRNGSGASSDRALLDRFLNAKDEAAFEALVARHGPMVLGVCHRLLASSHDADDAFQATFLVLVRKAGQIRDPARLGPWLYGVATRVASKARVRAARRRERMDAQVDEVVALDATSTGTGTGDEVEIRLILDAELGRLPAKHRDVLILCLLEGVTAEEAARQLGCPIGTIKSRLARGREGLRTRLTGRGIAPVAALAAVSTVFGSPVSAALTRTTLGTIAAGAADVAPSLVALTRGVVPAMLPKLTWMSSGFLLAGIALAGLGTATWIKHPAAAQQPATAGAVEFEPGPNRQAPDVELSAREQSKQNLQRILRAVHDYAQANHNELPPLAIYGPDGQPKLSWRVALLPYLNENHLYEEFHRDEPWNSPHNQRLLGRMPAVFATPHFPTPNFPAPKGQTRLRGFMGKDALFDGVRGIRFIEITDGTANTALLGSADEATPWTKPGELIFATGQPLPALEDHESNGWLVGMADGSVGDIPAGDGTLLQAIITRDWGEVMSQPFRAKSPIENPAAPSAGRRRPTSGSKPQAGAMFGGKPRMIATPKPDAGLPGMMPNPATPNPDGGMPGMMMSGMMPGPGIPKPPSTSLTVEQRLQKLEEKLESLIQRIDSRPSENGKP